MLRLQVHAAQGARVPLRHRAAHARNLAIGAGPGTGVRPPRETTFQHEAAVPRLPVPPLAQTLTRYVASLEPLATPDELAAARRAADAFAAADGPGEKLQAALQDFDRTQPGSWLEPVWLRLAYLGYRAPLPINSNWFVLFQDHPQHAATGLLSRRPPRGTFTAFQIKRAAGLAHALLVYKAMLDAEALPPETLRRAPLCMNQYRCQFGATRTPRPGVDELVTPHPAPGRHILVLAKRHAYRVPVIHQDGSHATADELEQQLMAVTTDAQQQPAPAGAADVAQLTAGGRDTWAEAFDLLMETPANAEAYAAVKDALFCICLDDHAPSNSESPSARAPQFYHNAGGGNRWYDKAIQLVVANNGQAGVNGEHTPADAIVPAGIFNALLEREGTPQRSSPRDPIPLDPAVRIQWDTSKNSDRLAALVAEAANVAAEQSADAAVVLADFDIYGSRYIKEVAGASPDAYVQMALQLAWHRAMGDPTAVYESASTRLFRHGRTETTRSLSTASWAFATAFDNDAVLYADKTALFRSAADAHSAFTRACMQGQGCDRHLLGLYYMALQTGVSPADIPLFADPLYARSTRFRLSTSQVTVPGARLRGGFGPVQPDGYGVNYGIYRDNLTFTVSASRKAAPVVDAHRFVQQLDRSLRDMMLLFPKRSEVWGQDFRAAQAGEKREEAAFGLMQRLSRDRVASLREQARRPKRD